MKWFLPKTNNKIIFRQKIKNETYLMYLYYLFKYYIFVSPSIYKLTNKSTNKTKSNINLTTFSNYFLFQHVFDVTSNRNGI